MIYNADDAKNLNNKFSMFKVLAITVLSCIYKTRGMQVAEAKLRNGDLIVQAYKEFFRVVLEKKIFKVL